MADAQLRTASPAEAVTDNQPRTAVGRARGTRPAVALVAFVAGALLVTLSMGEYGNSIVVVACINVVVVAGLHVLVHWAGQVSLGQVAFVAIGAFVTARANADFGLALPFAVAAGVLAAVAISLLVGLPALQLRGFALAIATLAFGFAADQWLFVQSWLVPVSTGVPLRDEVFLGFSIRDSREFVVPVLVITVVVVAAIVRLGSSGLGRATRVVAHDEEVAASYGISIGAHKLFSFLVAGGCAGLAGALMVMSIGRTGTTVFPPTLSILYVSAVLLGGRGPVWGSVIAAASLGAFPILVGGLGHYVALIGPVGILLVVRVFPDGLNGQLRMQAAAAAHLVHRLRGRSLVKEHS